MAKLTRFHARERERTLGELQLRVLYRQFLFLLVDPDLLSSHAQGDIGKLLGQLASLLIFFGLLLSMFPSLATLHLLISTTMLVIGTLAVLSWDFIFPNRRDVFVLSPLPIRTRTVFLAKAASLGAALGLSVGALNACAGFIFPLAVGAGRGIPGTLRVLLVFWITMLSAGAFIFCSVLTLQGIVSQLPRRVSLPLSAILQIALLCVFVGVYFMQPSLMRPDGFVAPPHQQYLYRLPSYWFLGLFQLLSGQVPESAAPTTNALARRAVLGLVILAATSLGAFLLSYSRSIRKIVEEPDLVPGFRRFSWLPRFGTRWQTAVVQFGIRTLFRSREHRIILGFYIGIGFAIATLFTKTGMAQRQLQAVSVRPWHHPNVPLLVSSIVMMSAWCVGIRAVFALPKELRANWIFRVTPAGSTDACAAANRWAFRILSVLPMLLASGLLFFSLWPWAPAAGHVVVLGLCGSILTDACLYGFHKIPFTCSYLPGKSNIHVTFWVSIGIIVTLLDKMAEYELRALQGPASFARLLLILVAAAAFMRWCAIARTKSDPQLQFEDQLSPVIQVLGLTRGSLRSSS